MPLLKNTTVLSALASKFRTAEVKDEFKPVIDMWAKRIINNAKRYKAVEQLTGVPWYFIALVHVRESSMNFSRHLHNGDPLAARTVRVPAGRPVAPPKNGKSYTWEESAIDAIKLMGLDKIKDWSLDQTLGQLEIYNGKGYMNNGKTNPYLWSYTQHYTAGKYIADGKYSATFVDKQPGTGAILKTLLQYST